jgi:hypothetical protein
LNSGSLQTNRAVSAADVPRRSKAFDYEYVEVAEGPKSQPAQVTVLPQPSGPDRIGGDGPFLSARNAVKFMVTMDGAPRRPLSSRMLDRSMSASEFAGLDGAAQAGMILYHVERLGRLRAAIVIASCAPRVIQCSCKRACCSGRKLSPYWYDAVHTIAEAALAALPPKSLTSYLLRSYLVVKIYGGKSITFKAIADELMLDEETVSRHHKVIRTWLQGAKAKKYSESVVGQESLAWQEAESVLWEAGVVRGA